MASVSVLLFKLRASRAVKRSIVFLCAVGLASCAVAPTQSTPSASNSHSIQYPAALRGAWMPKDIGCPTPINYDSESLLLIEADILGQYENTSKPLRIEQLSQRPLSWRIVAASDLGSGEYEGEERSTFTLAGNTLSIASDNVKFDYVRCK